MFEDIINALGKNPRKNAIDKCKKPISMAGDDIKNELITIKKLRKQSVLLQAEADARKDMLWVNVSKMEQFKDYDFVEYDDSTGMIVGCTSEEISAEMNKKTEAE